MILVPRIGPDAGPTTPVAGFYFLGAAGVAADDVGDVLEGAGDCNGMAYQTTAAMIAAAMTPPMSRMSIPGSPLRQ